MADQVISKQELIDAQKDAKSLEDVVNGNETKQVTTRLGESYPSVKKAIKTLFENGGLPATPFATKALMAASALVDGKYAQVTDDTVNNGLYVKTAGAWVKSGYDPLTQAKSYTDAASTTTLSESKDYTDTQKSDTLAKAQDIADESIAKVILKTTTNDISHGFIDSEGRLLGSFNSRGEFDFYPTEDTKNRLNVMQENDDSDYIYLILDKDGRILDGIDKHGNPVNSINQSSTSEIPLKTPLKTVSHTVSVKAFNRISQKLALNTTAKGRSTDPDIIVTGNGNTHPKMVYVPQGWNGYMYWLAATPTFGVVGGQAAYENPHVWASNDMFAWVELSGGRIDKPEDDNQSYWSDTHLVLDDDGWMYCIYRGSWFSFSDRCIVAKRSRDGVRWSDRIMIYNSNTDGGGADSGILSPAIYKSGTKWQMIDVLQDGKSIEFTTDYGNGVFRRSANEVIGKYEGYNTDKLVRYNPKQWGDTQQVWHIDALMVGNMHLHLVAVGDRGASMSSELYLAWSQDGWNFKVLPKLDINASNAYRSSLSVKDIGGSDVIFDLLLARTDGTIDLYELTLEIK